MACGSASVVVPSQHTAPPSSADVVLGQSLRDLEEASDRVVAQIHWDAADKAIREIGDPLAHNHHERSARLKNFLDQYGGDLPAGAVPVPACFTPDPPGSPLTPLDDAALIDRFLQHHDCAQALARMLVTSRSDAVRMLAQSVMSSYEADVKLGECGEVRTEVLDEIVGRQRGSHLMDEFRFEAGDRASIRTHV